MIYYIIVHVLFLVLYLFTFCSLFVPSALMLMRVISNRPPGSEAGRCEYSHILALTKILILTSKSYIVSSILTNTAIS